MKKAILFAITILLSVSCNCKKSATAKTETASLSGSWELNYITGPRIAFDGLYPNQKPTLNIDLKENRTSGKNSCNNYSGPIAIDGNKINFNVPGMMTTKIFCEGEGEQVYMKTLAKISSYSITDDGKTLNLISGDVAMMRYTRK